MTDYGPPPAGVSLVYIPDPRHDGWYVGVDWTGKPRATVKLAQPVTPPETLVQAPDGSAFMIPPFKVSGGAFLDRLGTPIADPGIQQDDRMMWADDSTRVCTLNASFAAGALNGRWRLGLRTPGSNAVAHPVALDTTTWSVGIIAIDLAACSARNDRAVLDYNWLGRPTDVYVARLSDGAVLLHQRQPAGALAGITASEDASLIAENSSKSIGALQVTPAPYTAVRRVANGATVAELDPSYGVIAFSSDDALALVSTTPIAAGVPTNLALVRLADGAVLWHRQGALDFAGARVRPDGADLAFQLGTAPGPVELVIVHPDGTATSLRFQ